jgi:hypothetical protein
MKEDTMKRLMFLLTAVAAFASVGPHAAAEITEQVVFQRQKDGDAKIVLAANPLEDLEAGGTVRKTGTETRR